MCSNYKNMHTVECQLIFAGFLVLLMQLYALPVDNSINQLMFHASDRLGLVKYFKNQKLEKYCDGHSILDDEHFKLLEPKYPEPCLCTVIYNMTQELESNPIITSSEVEEAIQHYNNIDENNYSDAFKAWENVASLSLSSSLKLFMAPLKNSSAWQLVCHVEFSVDNVSPLCQFLNLEITLIESLYNSTMKESKQKPTNNASENNQKELSSMLKTKELEQNKSEDLPSTNSKTITDEDNQDSKIEAPDEPISVKEEQPDTSNKDDENTNTDYQTEIDSELATESKSNIKPINDNSKDDYGTILQIETKSRLQKDVFGGPEETHFLFYFGIMTILSMLFYLALYNKKKIIALVIEGRRSTGHRRRPNTASYSKVETDDGSTVF